MDVLVLGHGQRQAFLGRLGVGLGLGQVDADARLHHRRRDHEDDQQDQHDVDERRDVDLGHVRADLPPARGGGRQGLRAKSHGASRRCSGIPARNPPCRR